MKNDNIVIKGGASFTEILQIVFIILKLCHVVEWSWIWVLAPTWISLVIAIIVIIIAIIWVKH